MLLYFMTLFWFREDQLTFRVTEITKTVAAKKSNHFLNSIGQICSYKDQIFAIDAKDSFIFSLDTRNQKVAAFSGAGAGPEQLQPKISSFFTMDNQLRVLHGNGLRMVVFEPNGTFKTSHRIMEHGSLLFYSDEAIVAKKEKLFKAWTPAGFLETKAFPIDTFGFSLRTASFGDFFLIATETAKQDHFSLIIFDLAKGEIHTEKTLPTILKNFEGGLPPQIVNMLKKDGIPVDRLFLVVLEPVITHEEMGFILKEVNHHKPNHSILHTFHPGKRKEGTIKIIHDTIRSPAFFFPLQDGAWVTFDSYENQFLFLEMEKVQ